MEDEKIKVYTCGVNWQHECQDVPHTVKFYGSVEELKSARRCWISCGIVELELSLVQWLHPQNLYESLDE